MAGIFAMNMPAAQHKYFLEVYMKYAQRCFFLPAIFAAALLYMACPTGEDNTSGENSVTYTVTFDLGYSGGTVPAAIEVMEGQAPVNIFPADPVRDEYEFSGWYAGQTKYTRYTAITGNVTLTAQWEALYTVAFVIGYEGAVSPPSIVLKSGQNGGILFPPDPVREDYIFRGWFAGTDKYDLTTSITASVTLTAQWFQGYAVTLIVAGGMAEMEPLAVERNQPMGDLFPADPQLPEKFTFTGWYDSADTKYTDQTTINGDITLTGRWAKAEDVDRISARNGAFPVFKFTVPDGDRFGNYTKITVKFFLNDENQSTAAPIIRLYGPYVSNAFTLESGTAYRGTNDANNYLVFNDNMWTRNTWNGEQLNKNSLPQKEWFTVEIPFDLARFNATANLPGKNATGDFYFGLGLGLGGGTASAVRFTSYMTEVTLSNNDGSKKIVSPGGGFDKPVVIGTGLVDITRE
jgi:uncharacterized repeat protein (TIGR02543 family)